MSANILIASSAYEITDLVKEALESLDYQVIPAKAMSLALFLAQKNLPDLIILGATMMDGDPAAFMRELKSDLELKSVPTILLVHANQDIQALKESNFAGVDDVMWLPIEKHKLRDELLPYIKKRQSTKEKREPQTPE